LEIALFFGSVHGKHFVHDIVCRAPSPPLVRVVAKPKPKYAGILFSLARSSFLLARHDPIDGGKKGAS
jgi:hypothetical protein